MSDAAANANDDPPLAPRALVVLCTYNEAGNLPRLFEALDKHVAFADILVVDDNSPDGTADWIRQRMQSDSATHLLLRSGKLGLGTALRDAIRWCLARDYDYLINLDADLSHDPAAIPTMLQACIDQEADVAVGTRYLPGGSSPGLSFHRKLISRTLNGYANWLLELPLTDCSGSFRCYRTNALRKLNLDQLSCPGYGFLEEILVALHRNGGHFAQVPIVFDCRHAGDSKLSFHDAVGAIGIIHRLAFQSKKRTSTRSVSAL